MALDLSGIDDVARINCRNKAVDFDFLSIFHRELTCRSSIASIGMHLRNSAINPSWCWLIPANAFGYRIKNSCSPRVFGKILQTESKRVFANVIRHFIHKSLNEDAVLVYVHAAPKSRGHMRVTHCMINEQIREVVCKCMLPLRIQALKYLWIQAFISVQS